MDREVVESRLLCYFQPDMTLSENDLKELESLEESLWRADTRFDHAYMEHVLAPDFFEFGRSGRVYQREDTLNVGKREEIPTTFPLHGFTAHPLDENTVLVTYISEVAYKEGLEIGNRSSIWTKMDGKWRLRFHQGTPTTKSF